MNVMLDRVFVAAHTTCVLRPPNVVLPASHLSRLLSDQQRLDAIRMS